MYFWKLVLPTLVLILVFIDVWVFCFSLVFVMPRFFLMSITFTRLWKQLLACDPYLLWYSALLENNGIICLRFERSRFESLLSLTSVTIDELFVRWSTELLSCGELSMVVINENIQGFLNGGNKYDRKYILFILLDPPHTQFYRILLEK